MPNDDTVGKGGWGGENVSKSDGAILECSLTGCVLENKTTFPVHYQVNYGCSAGRRMEHSYREAKFSPTPRTSRSNFPKLSGSSARQREIKLF